MQFFFVNGRLVKSGTASAALSEAYKNSIMVGKFPYCVLNITTAPGLVDVNVHPAKTEVRFANERTVFSAIYYAAKMHSNAEMKRRKYLFRGHRRRSSSSLHAQRQSR